MSRIRVAFAVALTLGYASTVGPQTIPELARGKPSNPVVRTVFRHIRPATLEELAVGAHLVVDGTLVKTRSYLTNDEWDILTDFQIINSRVIAGQAPPATSSRQTPGPLTPLTLTVYGGELRIEGQTVRALSYDFADFRSGGRFLLFLRPAAGAAPGRYWLYRGAAFEIELQRLKPLLVRPRRAYKEVADSGYDQIVAEIQRATAKRQ